MISETLQMVQRVSASFFLALLLITTFAVIALATPSRAQAQVQPPRVIFPQINVRPPTPPAPPFGYGGGPRTPTPPNLGPFLGDVFNRFFTFVNRILGRSP